jgi:hypothetical protein
MLYLSMIHASSEVGITEVEAQQFVKFVMEEQGKSPWPPGFF